MTAAAIDNEITSCLHLLNNSQKEAILTVMKTFAREPLAGEYSEEFQNEINDRFAEYETGKTTGFTLEETENRAGKTYRSNKR